MAMGMSAPCNKPRRKPAGWEFRSREASTRLRIEPMMAARRQISRILKSNFNERASAGEEGGLVSLIFPSDDQPLRQLNCSDHAGGIGFALACNIISGSMVR